MKYVFEVKRVRSSVTQGSAVVLLNGKEMISFHDEIELIKEGEKYYGENIGGWASKEPDEAFIRGLLFHPLDSEYKYSKPVRDVLDKAVTEARV